MTADSLAAALDGIRQNHQQHVSVNFPEPGICVSRDGSWPCDAAVLLAALDEVLKLHRVERRPEALGGYERCPEDLHAWRCSTYRAISRSLSGGHQ